ncbi:MAG TPA: zinc ribbon domain-containing protein [Candidatus Omnitrophota bacterium]|nr:zinc ribbon domain-containing protein [Candidatus Omnitrophota bacterium]HPD84157.1 zinc ribbon domain-containing protein [Candidatus Omnitrophota bacterium]HRZ03014.1 zinc ribbon domain-containing protein [Candidatus Omnitrophota bacterium]
MPTYQYECSACGHQLEAFQSMTEKKLKKCPKCGKNSLDRLIGSGTGIIFKGSGFYETDYKRKEQAQTDSSKASSHSGSCCSSCPHNPKASAGKK